MSTFHRKIVSSSAREHNYDLPHALPHFPNKRSNFPGIFNGLQFQAYTSSHRDELIWNNDDSTAINFN